MKKVIAIVFESVYLMLSPLSYGAVGCLYAVGGNQRYSVDEAFAGDRQWNDFTLEAMTKIVMRSRQDFLSRRSFVDELARTIPT